MCVRVCATKCEIMVAPVTQGEVLWNTLPRAELSSGGWLAFLGARSGTTTPFLSDSVIL